jgi:hypothetical protein
MCACRILHILFVLINTNKDRLGVGLHPSGTLTRTVWWWNLTELGHDAVPTQSSGARLSLRLLIDDTLEVGPWLLPGLWRQPRLGSKKTSSGRKGLGAPRRCALGMALPTILVTRSRMGVTQEDKLLRPPGARWFLGPRASP